MMNARAKSSAMCCDSGCLDAHDLPMCLRRLLEFFALCSVFHCRSSLHIFLNCGYFEPGAPRKLRKVLNEGFLRLGFRACCDAFI